MIGFEGGNQIGYTTSTHFPPIRFEPTRQPIVPVTEDVRLPYHGELQEPEARIGNCGSSISVLINKFILY